MIKSIEGFPNYLISSVGEVFKIGRKEPLKLFKNVDGYNCIVLYKDGQRYHKRVCRLVAEHFVENPQNKPVVNHKNLIRDDDNFTNLEWVTVLENNLHGIQNNIAAHRGKATITEQQADTICKYLSAGLRSVDIAGLVDVSKDVVDHISKGKTWKEVYNRYQMPAKGSRVSKITAKWVLSQLEVGLTPEEILNMSTNKRLSLELIYLIKDRLIYKELDKPSTIIP